MSPGPFTLTGEPFLILYGALFAATIVAGFVIPHRLRPGGCARRVTEVDELAILSGYIPRFGDAMVARLLAAGALTMIGKDQFLARPAPAASVAERSVLGLSQPMRWREIDRTLRSYAEPVERRLVDAGLVMSAAERGNIRFWALLPYLILLAFGATKWVIGDMREQSIGYLTVLLIVTAVLAFVRWRTVDRRTQAGLEAAGDAAARNRRLEAAPTSDEVGLAVALFGTSVLVGSGWSDFHRLRTGRGGGGDSGGSCGGGCRTGGDSGGCGGGGCGS